MHDLNTINRLNAEAFADSIAKHRAAGRFVLAKYEGLALVSIEAFSDRPSAQQAFDATAAVQHGGGRSVLFAPTQAGVAVPQRDQSEDRKQPYTLEQLATLGRRNAGGPPDVTLADYINRKTI